MRSVSSIGMSVTEGGRHGFFRDSVQAFVWPGEGLGEIGCGVVWRYDVAQVVFLAEALPLLGGPRFPRITPTASASGG